MNVEHLSMITTPVLLLKGDTLVSQGTGFYFRLQATKGSILFLVTNHHVLTGYAPKENKPPIGDNVIFYVHKDADNPGNTKEIRFPLFTKDKKPIWLNSKRLLKKATLKRHPQNGQSNFF